MLSRRLLQLIETHWDEITSRLIVAIKRHPDMPHLARRPDANLHEWCEEILTNLRYALSGSNDQDVGRRFRALGRMRFEEHVPLHEAILRAHLLKDTIIDLIHEQGFPMTAMHLYAEQELEERIGRFFDAVVYDIVRGYEDAWSVALRVA